MSNEKKILSILTKMQSDMQKIQTDIEALKKNGTSQEDNNKTISEVQWTILETMRNLLTKEEKDALGKYQEAEEARKAALYG